MLTLMPTDSRAIPISILAMMILRSIDVAYFIYSAVSTRSTSSDRCSIGDHTVQCWGAILFSSTRAFAAVIFLLIGLWMSACVWKSVASHQLYKQLVAALMMCGLSNTTLRFLLLLVMVCAGEIQDVPLVVVTVLEVLMLAIFCLISLSKRLTQKLQSWLVSQGGAATAAASIAELVTERDVALVLKSAQNTFRCISANRLLYADMEEKKPNPALAKLAKRATLGCVDAFISHSWSDSPAKKWTALQKWREDFKAQKGGREPRMWIDKYCIDQRSIEESLACLPVCLAGCSKLVVLCGETYLQRLWCLLEIYVFLEMGGDLDHLEVHLLSSPTTAESDIDAMRERLVQFDAKHARSSTEEDTARLQAVLGLAGYEKINLLVRSVFRCQLATLELTPSSS